MVANPKSTRRASRTHHDIDTPHTVGIIGYPLEHTLSPQIHNALFQKMGLPYVYLPFRVERAHLQNLVRTMRLMDVEGLNVTSPHKTAVLPLLDRIDKTAARIGAVNTIVMRNHRAIGYNTDAPGFVAALHHSFGLHPRGLHVCVLGAGGAARAIIDALLHHRVGRLTVLNRTLAHAQRLVRDFARHYPRAAIAAAPLTAAQMRQQRTCDVIVQATSALTNASLRWPTLSRPAPMVMDIRYGAIATQFLAASGGSHTADGLEMLIQQAACSVTLWTGATPDLAAMRRHARRLIAALPRSR